MKTLFLTLLVACSLPLFAEEETLLGSTPVDHGGYGALVVKFTSVNNQFGVLVGARGGWIVNHTFAVGFAGYGLVNEVAARVPGPLGQPFVNLGYGGLDLEYIANSDELIHYSVHSLIGAGVVGTRGVDWDDLSWDFDDHWDSSHHRFFVIEPGANIDLNVATWFRVSVGASYRFVGGVSSDASTREDLSGPSGMLTLRFGAF